MNRDTLIPLINYLREFMSESRVQTLKETVLHRTRHLTVVLEDIYQPHNASAVLRSCDGFGVQDVHIIENRNEFDANSQVTLGADQWLNLNRYNQEGVDNTKNCIDHLKKAGYQIIATTPHENDSNLQELDVTIPTALVFGSEVEGVTDRVMDLADGYVKIPMYGFSESFNISVSAAICLYDITTRLRLSDINWQLKNDEQTELLYHWMKNSIKAGDQLVAKFLSEHNF